MGLGGPSATERSKTLLFTAPEPLGARNRRSSVLQGRKPLKIAARACPEATEALKIAARACCTAAKPLKIIARACLEAQKRSK